MREEIIIKDYIKSWLKPSDGRTLKLDNFNHFLDVFRDDESNFIFNDDERLSLKQLFFYHPKGISLAAGYPQGDKETPELATIYFTEGGWQQGQPGGNYLGSRTREGRASTQITVTGITQGDNLKFTHPSLMVRLITALLISGEGELISKRILNQTISETLLPVDQQVSYGKIMIPIRSLLISYESRRSGVNTNREGY